MWKALKEEKPKLDKLVLAYFDHEEPGFFGLGTMIKDGHEYWFKTSELTYSSDDTAIYWMDLPDRPEAY